MLNKIINLFKKKSQSKKTTSNKVTSNDGTILLIDSIFLSKAIYSTLKIYSEIYPERKFEKIMISQLIKNLVSYFKKNIKEIHLVLCEEFPLDDNLITLDTNEVNIENNIVSIKQTNCDFVCAEIGDIGDSSIYNGILLLADDSGYLPILKTWQSKGKDLILIRFDEDSNMYTNPPIKYQKIGYILGPCLGLQQHEL